jgi:hypothetical protein
MPKSSSLYRPEFNKQKNRPHASPDAEPDIYEDFVQLSFNLEVSDEDAGNPSCDQSESGTSHLGSTPLDVLPSLPQ